MPRRIFLNIHESLQKKTVRNSTFVVRLRVQHSPFIKLIGLFCWGISVSLGNAAYAQLWGIVWRPPQDTLQALVDWQAIRQLGVRVVQIEGGELPAFILDIADSLGIAVYVSLPIEALPARALERALPIARQQLRALFERAGRHPSLHAIGLAQGVDTADPAACFYFETLAAEVRRYRSDLHVYYETVFIESDQCGHTVDRVLLDARDVDDPLLLLRRWLQAHPRIPVGIGKLGTWVRADTLRGLEVPHAPEVQARYFEQHLRRLQGWVDGPVFVYRWRDVPRQRPALHHDQPYWEPYGLYTPEGLPRPARDVVHGWFTGKQRIFAFPKGHPPSPPWPWEVMLAWVPIVLLAMNYRVSPLWRLQSGRYFRAHGFYIEAVQWGRDLPLGSILAFGLAQSVALGVSLAIGLPLLRQSRAVAYLVGLLPLWVQEGVLLVLQYPVILLFLMLVGVAVGMGLWSLGLVLLSYWGHRIGYVQALTLALMPRWIMLVLLMVALGLLGTKSPAGGSGLLALWLVCEGWSMQRTLRDAWQVVGGHLSRFFVAVLFHPGFILLGVVLAGAAGGLHSGDMYFLWHLLLAEF